MTINLPYDELLYHLDLSILAYHMYHQTLVWPLDPYYEYSETLNERDQMMKTILSQDAHKNMYAQNGANNNAPYGIERYRGPGSFMDRRTRAGLDPIITRYDRLNPWYPSIVCPEYDKDWVLIVPPEKIVDKIKEVRIAYYDVNRKIFAITPQDTLKRPNPVPALEDSIYCFEGGTGSTNFETKDWDGDDTDQAWSIMGFILVRHSKEKIRFQQEDVSPYDLHITFRGSRSGSGARSLMQASTSKDTPHRAKGNPDWVTDLSYQTNGIDTDISLVGEPSLGFKTCIKSMLPSIYTCLEAILEVKSNQPPRNIFVTGHSLGGALAAQFASTIALGKFWKDPGPAAAAAAVDNINKADRTVNLKSIRNWPWHTMRLITFSAPKVGDENMIQAMSSVIYGRRIYVAGDPIPNDKIPGVHFGQEIRLPNPDIFNLQRGFLNALLGIEAHEPIYVRTQLIKFLELRDKQALEEIDKKSPMVKYKSFKDLWTKHRVEVFASNAIVPFIWPEFYKLLMNYLDYAKEAGKLDQASFLKLAEVFERVHQGNFADKFNPNKQLDFLDILKEVEAYCKRLWPKKEQSVRFIGISLLLTYLTSTISDRNRNIDPINAIYPS